MPDKRLKKQSPRATLASVNKEMALPRESQIRSRSAGTWLTMDNPKSDKDRLELQCLENIVRHHKAIETTALALESGISAERVCEVLSNYFSSVSPEEPGFGDVWVYKPTMADRAAERECKDQEDQLDRQKCQCRAWPF